MFSPSDGVFVLEDKMYVKANENDLFEVIWSKVGCMYMSDLKDELYREQAIREAKRMDLSKFDEKQIADLCSYLSVAREEIA